MRPLWRGVALGAAAYLLFLLINVPASWVAGRLTSQVPTVQLSGLSGSIWSGRASRLQAESITLTEVHWHWHPFALLAGRVEYGLTGRWSENPVALSAGTSLFGGAYLSNVEVAAPAPAWIAALRLPLEASGDVAVALSRVRFVDGAVVPIVQGGVSWSPAAVKAPVALELGRLTVDLSPEGQLTRGKISAKEGKLLVEGSLQVEPSGAYQLDAELTPNGQLPNDIRAGLEAVAELRGGRYHLEWKDLLN